MRYALCLTLLLAGWAAAQPAKPAPAPPPKPADPARFDPDAPLPEIKVEGVTLEDLVQFLQDARPGFQAVVVRDPGAPRDYPQITMRLKNVSTMQLLGLIQKAYPQVTIDDTTEGPGGVVYCIKVIPDPAPQGGGFAGGGMLGQRLDLNARYVQVYSLARAVNMLAAEKAADPKDRAKAGRDATNQLLSLLKAAITQSDADGANAALQVHEETQTLVFKGTPAQQQLIDSVLRAVAPPDDDARKSATEKLRQMERAREELELRLRRLEDELAMTQKLMREQQALAMEKALEAEKLKIRLEMMQEMQREIDKLRAVERGKAPAKE